MMCVQRLADALDRIETSAAMLVPLHSAAGWTGTPAADGRVGRCLHAAGRSWRGSGAARRLVNRPE
jgi:hypothetical protein